ncbi:MAG TPA: HEAT repeat domain-containing protein, partial [Longimicrobiales bacterium]
DDDVEIRKQAVFALSQLKGDQSLDALMEVARNSKDPQVRKNALFWLSQKDDPRVLALFEEILLKN